MKYSKIYPKTRKEDPKTVVSTGTKLLVRAGLVEQVSSGLWIMTTLGLLVRKNIENIVREEMNKAGAIEFEFPILQPRKLWEESGRWNRYVEDEIAFKLTDRKDIDYFLAPTAEEMVTYFARKNLKSYKDLPVNIWQMSTKFRDEIRPRQGLIRGREFMMKDAYSFDQNEESMSESYKIMASAYQNIFEKTGLNFIKVEADSGSIGGNNSAEYMALTEIGEDVLLYCPKCNYGANQEKAQAYFPAVNHELNKIVELETPDIKTVDDLYKFTGVNPEQMIKTVILEVDDNPVIVSLRGDLEISEIKLMNLLNGKKVKNASPEIVQKVTNAPVGFAGPINLYKKTEFKYLFDVSTKDLKNFLCGGNKKDIHYIDVNFGVDVDVPQEFHDISKAVKGLNCPSCHDGILDSLQGIEVGHIFQLGQVYSKPMEAKFINNQGKEEFFWMGCYGIGISRIVQTLAEQWNDEKGIIWPENISPFEIVVIAVNNKYHLNDATNIYEELKSKGYKTLLDDSDSGAGGKFIDAELMGIPLQIVVGKAWQNENTLELRWRNTKNYDSNIFKIEKENALPSTKIELSELDDLLKKVLKK